MELQIIKDIYQQIYLAFDFQLNQLDSQSNTLKSILELGQKIIPNFNQYQQNLLLRNSNSYHLTLFSVKEVGQFPQLLNLQGSILQTSIFTYLGIGSISQNDMITYFITIDCPILNKLREQHNLTIKDLHITIAFSHKDLFKHPKNNTNILQL